MLCRIYLNKILAAGMFLFYWLLIVQPPAAVPTPELDPSWSSALSYFAAGRWQLGSEIIFTFGPLGFIYPNYYSGYWLTATILIELLVKAAIAWQLLLVTKRAGKPWGLLFFLLILLFSHPIKDYLFHFSITLALILIIEALHHRRRLIIWVAFLAILSLIKFSFLVMSLAGLVSIGIYAAIDRNWKSLVALAAVYAVSLLLVWTLAGQNPFGIYDYLIAGWQIAAGYQKSMFHRSDSAPLIVGLTMLAASAIILILYGVNSPQLAAIV